MKTKHTLLASVIATSLLVGCGSDDDPITPPPADNNTAPVAGVIADMTTTSATKIMIDVVAKATDADGDAISLVSATAMENRGHARLVDGQIQYSPGGYVGEDVIDYVISDGQAQTQASINVVVTEQTIELTYMGSASCAGCHSAEYAAHQQSGHNFKIMKISKDQPPQFPFNDGIDYLAALEGVNDDATDGSENDPHAGTDNSLGKPADYSEVSFTTGGYWKKIRWFDKNGHIVTGSAVQYNTDDGSYSGYHDDEVDMMYDCGNCHTTGWRPYDGDNDQGQYYPYRHEGLPGMGGDFEFAGVQCEACHGAGSAHVAAPSQHNITKIAQPRSTELLQSETMGFGAPMHCAECHTRDGNREGGDLGNNYVSAYNSAFPNGPEYGARINAKGGLPRHHQGHDEFMAVDPATGEATGTHYRIGMSCNSCHNPHMSTVNNDQPLHQDAVKTCSDCHTDKQFNDSTVGVHDYFECTDCHMPEVVKNATSHTNAYGQLRGDEMIHTVKIDLFNSKGQLTDDGKYMNPFLKYDYACGQCHVKEGELGNKLDVLEKEYGGKIHK